MRIRSLLLAFLLGPTIGTLAALTPALAAAKPSSGALFLEALAAADLGDYEQALKTLDRVAEAAPDDPYVELQRAGLLLRVGRLEQASESAARARLLGPENHDALRLQGRIELLRADRDAEAATTARAAFERLRESDPEDLEALVSLGQLYLAADQPGLAAEALAEASRLRPGHAGIESLLARALESGADAERVERVQRDRLIRNPTSLATRLELADLLAREGRPREATEVLRGADAEQRESLDVRRRLAPLLFLAGDVDEALEIARGVVEQWPSYAGGRLLLARIEAAFGRFAEAEGILAPLLGSSPLPEPVAEVQVRILEGLGRIDEAAEQLERDRLRSESSDLRAEADSLALELARLWARHGRFEEALAPARRASESPLTELAEDGRLLLASLLGRLERADAALEVLGPPESKRPRFATARIGVLLDAGREAEAGAEIERLLAERPEADLRIGGALAEREKYDEAIPLLHRAAEREPRSIEALFRLGAAYERSGRIGDSVEQFRGLLSNAPDFAPALNYLGYLWIDRSENLDEAVELVRRAVRLDPDNGAYVDSLGWGYYRLGRVPEAIEVLEWAARLEPDDATVLEHLGDALVAAGERKRAAEVYRRAAASASGGETSEAARKLEQLRDVR